MPIDTSQQFTVYLTGIPTLWDGNWHPETQTYDANGITKTGEGIAMNYTKTSSNPDEYTISVAYEWQFYLRNKQGIPQTFHISVPTTAAMYPFYHTVHDGHVFKPWYTEDGVTFTRCESSYDDATSVFTFTFTPASQYSLTSIFYPWNYTKNQSFMTWLQNQNHPFMNISQVTTSPNGRNVTMVEITDDFSLPETNKKHVFMIGRQGAVESMNSPILAAMINHIADVPVLRQNMHWYFILEINPDGCAGVGGFQDQTWDTNVNPIIVAVRNKCQQIENDYTLDMFFDWHALGSGFGSHIIYDPLDTVAPIVCALMRQYMGAVGRWGYWSAEYGNHVAFSYAFHTWGAISFTPEPSQAEWNYTAALLKNDGEKIADAIYDYFF
jgi:hypothetical protein